MQKDQKRICSLCVTTGLQSQMLKIGKHRFKTLNVLYPCLQTSNDWIHKACMANLGLHPFPKGRIHLERIFRNKQPSIKTETLPETTPPVIVQPSAADPWVCTRCATDNIRQRCDTSSPHSNVTAKRAHRKWIIEYVLQHSAKHPALLYLDDRLPVQGSDTTTYFTEDLLKASPRIRPHQLFSPNLKSSVVEDLRRLGVLHTEESCVCLFLQRYAPVIRDLHGGVALAFLDVWGGFDKGAFPLIEISVSLRLLNPSGCMVTFATSDLSGRFQGQTTVDTFSSTYCKAQELFDGRNYKLKMCPAPDGVSLSYNTMQIHAWVVKQ